MLSYPAPFPYVGSQGFERGTGRPLTILQLRADGRALTRRDDVATPSHDRGSAAEGNFTLALADICERHAESLKPAPRRRSRK